MRSTLAHAVSVRYAAFALHATFILAACSASIGIGVDIGGDRIGTANAPIAAASALDTMVTLAGPGIGIGDDPARAPTEETPRRALVTATVDWIEIAAAQRGVALPAPGGRFSSDQSFGCGFGTMRVRSGFANSVVFAAGDTIELDATDCRFGDVRFRGGLTIRVLDASGFPGFSSGWTARVALDYRSWRVETVALPLQARAFEGRAALAVRRLNAVDADLSFDSAALSIAAIIDGAPGAERRAESLSLRMVDTVADDALQFDLRLFDARLADAGLDALQVGSVGTIVVPGSPRNFPAGQVRIGDGDDSVVFADFDAAQIRLDIDRFVDGRIDASQIETWQGLRSRL